MTEHVLRLFACENRQILAEYLVFISILYIAVIIAIVYIGQRTRIKSPFPQSKFICQQMTECEAFIDKLKTSQNK